MYYALIVATSLAVLGPGALAPVDPMLFDEVELTRIRHGYGLDELAGPGVVKVAVEDCAYLGYRGVLVVEGEGVYPAYVIDCQQEKHTPLSELGLLCDMDRPELAHGEGLLILWRR